jgi:hypothetical protein
VGGELVEVVISAAAQPVVRVGNRPIDASAARLLDCAVAALAASVRALIAVVIDAAPGELGRADEGRLIRG